MADQIQTPAPPTHASEAAARLDALKSDSAWGEKFLAADGSTLKEYSDLRALIDGGDKVELALAGVVPGGDVPNADDRRRAQFASMLREDGLADGVIRQAIASEGVPKAEFDAVTVWKAQRMRDPKFVESYLAGDPEAVRQMTTANIVIANGVKK